MQMTAVWEDRFNLLIPAAGDKILPSFDRVGRRKRGAQKKNRGDFLHLTRGQMFLCGLGFPAKCQNLNDGDKDKWTLEQMTAPAMFSLGGQ
jgi:hypothetical protein